MFKVPPRFELGLLDSKSRVLAVTPWNHICGPTEIRTRIAGFRVQSASRYTMGPLQ
ncbi:hypothetical protein T10_8513 [Trichinella papuae]|uniref:Uncharacterized protein n=1 Tax=Trichinella papuae TaxID=268474 RepID=A0A0V1MKX0_9BILA|nr:hypothetical protein T10_8513 [Trichinella papuae]